MDHTPDDDVDELIHRADLDGLVRMIDDRTSSRDWEGLLRVRDRARAAVDTGRQLWPAATLAEYRLALLGPPELVAVVLDESDGRVGRFAIGPLTEVAAQHHTWVELAPQLARGPRAAFVAHERAIRGEDVDGTDLAPVLDIPTRLAAWEPNYPLATYHDSDVECPAPDLPTAWEPVEGSPGAEHLDDDTELAVRQLVEPWTTASNGRVDVCCVAGDAAAALGALGVRQGRTAVLTPGEALTWIAWAGASGGAHGRRRGAAAGRYGAWWLLAALGDLLDEWPVAPAVLGELADELHWFRWDAFEPALGWQLRLVVEDPDDGVAWAISALDSA